MASPTPLPKRRRWPKIVGIVAVVFVVLVVALYFVGTSAAFFKGVILPKVSAALNAKVTVADASISPFSNVILRDLKVETTGTDPLVSAPEVRARYSLWDIIKGNMTIHEIVLTSPTIVVVKNADGTSNLDPLTKKESSGSEEKKEEPKRDSKPPQVNLGKFDLNNATVRQITYHPGGKRDLMELSGLNVTLENLKNGGTGKLAFSANIAIDNQPPAPATNGLLRSKLDGSFDIALGNDLSLSAFKGGTRLNVSETAGAFAQLAGLALVLDTDLAADPNQQVATLRALNLRGSQNDKLFLTGTLSQPMAISWGGNAGNVGDASLVFALTNINLADWKAFAPEFDAAGGMNAVARITSKQAGKQVDFDLNAQLQNLSAVLNSNRVDGLSVELTAAGGATDSKLINVTNYHFAAKRRNEPVATLDGSALVDTGKQSVEARVRMDAALPRLLEIAPQPGMSLTSGGLKLDVQVAQTGEAQNVSGTLVLDGLTGNYGEQRFTNLTTKAAYDVGLKQPQQIDLRKFELTLTGTSRVPTNIVNLSGQIDLSQTNALEGALKLVAQELDVTPYYDLAAGQPKPSEPQKTETPPPSKPTPPGGQKEPEPVQLPVKNLVFDARIGRCFLRELDMSNMVATVTVAGSQVSVQPLQFVLNGSPVDAGVDLNLGVPGYQYALKLKADRLPIEPIANSFAPDYKGRAKGDLIADIQIKGAGITGPNLRKNLAANLGLSFTNADIQITGARLKKFLLPIAAALKAPGILETPLNNIGLSAGVDTGKFKLGQFALMSPAFAAATKGEATLADDPKQTRLPNMPLQFQLQRALAERLGLAPKDMPTNATYAQLPNFVKVAGTLDEPKPEIDLKALAGAALLKYTDKIPGLDEKTGDLLKGVGGILSGQKPANTNAGSTNAPATNRPPGAGLLDLLKKPKN